MWVSASLLDNAIDGWSGSGTLKMGLYNQQLYLNTIATLGSKLSQLWQNDLHENEQMVSLRGWWGAQRPISSKIWGAMTSALVGNFSELLVWQTWRPDK